VPIEPATPALATVPIEPATPALAMVPLEPATPALAASSPLVASGCMRAPFQIARVP
jgi:hypothetical protein